MERQLIPTIKELMKEAPKYNLKLNLSKTVILQHGNKPLQQSTLEELHTIGVTNVYTNSETVTHLGTAFGGGEQQKSQWAKARVENKISP